MNEEAKKPDPQDLTGDGLGDATATQADAAPAGEREPDQGRIAELETRLLRAQADYENFKRRVQREKEDLAVYANQKLILNLLPVLDNLERALGAPKAEGDEKLRQGVELTARSFRDTLAREGVTPIEAVGQTFDPNLHDAIMTVDSPEHDEDVIVMEFEKGYRLGERVIRPSRVQVCKKG